MQVVIVKTQKKKARAVTRAANIGCALRGNGHPQYNYFSLLRQILCKFNNSALRTGGISILSIRSIACRNITISFFITLCRPP